MGPIITISLSLHHTELQIMFKVVGRRDTGLLPLTSNRLLSILSLHFNSHYLLTSYIIFCFKESAIMLCEADCMYLTN